MKEVILNQEIEFAKIFSLSDVLNFVQISEDNNPIHIDENYASKSIFQRRIVHGVLLVSMFSKIFGTIYPGDGTIYMSQTSYFLKPAYIGELIKANVKLTSFNVEKKQGIFLTECFNEAGTKLVTGEAKIKFPSTFEFSKVEV